MKCLTLSRNKKEKVKETFFFLLQKFLLSFKTNSKKKLCKIIWYCKKLKRKMKLSNNFSFGLTSPDMMVFWLSANFCMGIFLIFLVEDETMVLFSENFHWISEIKTFHLNFMRSQLLLIFSLRFYVKIGILISLFWKGELDAPRKFKFG